MPATVLLVEDERKLRELVRSYLERAGHMVLSTGSGAEAISLAATTWRRSRRPPPTAWPPGSTPPRLPWRGS